MLVDNDSGNPVWQWESTAFGVGKPTGSVTFNLRFPGQYYDEFTGLHYNLNRYYNPELGRYMEPDPIGLEGGLNPYVYADNNPLSNVDPSGLDCIGGSCSSGFEQGMYDWWPGYKFGTGLYNSYMSGSNQFSFWEGVDGGASFLGSLGKGLSWTAREVNTFLGNSRFLMPELEWSTKVGRWMSPNEFSAMQKTNMVQESMSGTTHVAFPADANAFMRQAQPGSMYVEFFVPSNSLKVTNLADGWAKILGPRSVEGRLALKKKD